MAAEERMHNPKNPPAAESRAAETHALDLTSVCVRSGEVLLPRALLGRFGPGEVLAQTDGGEVALEFRPPRTLAGLAEFFELHGLQANDRLVFSFEESGLRLSAQRRDRQRRDLPQRQPGKRPPAEAGRPAAERAAPMGGTRAPERARTPERARATEGAPPPTRAPSAERAPSADAAPSSERASPAERAPSAERAPASDRGAGQPASDWYNAVDQREAEQRRLSAEAAAAGGQGASSAKKGIVVDRFRGAVGELLQPPARKRERAAQAAADAAAAAEAASAPHTEGWRLQQPAGQERRVTKVRIEGGVPLNASTSPARPKERTSAHQVWARRENAHWHSLDTLQAVQRHAGEHDPDFPDTVVRAYRRTANGTRRAEPIREPGGQAGDRPESTAPAAASAPTWQPATGQRARPAPATQPAPRSEPPQPFVERRAPAAAHARTEPEFAQLPDDPGVYVPSDHEASEGARGARSAFLHELEAASGMDAHAPARDFSATGDEDRRAIRRSVIGRLGLRLGIGRERASAHVGELPGRGPSAGAPSAVASQASAPQPAPPQPRQAPGVGPGPLFGTTPLAQASDGGAASSGLPASHGAPIDAPPPPMPHSGSASPTPARVAQPRRERRAVTVQDALLGAEVDVRPAAPRRDPAAEPPPPTATIEDDMAFLESYLLRPGTPAIVRSIDLAERLGMSPERAHRAMERLSEQRERFSRIRDGAYMVRQQRGRE